MTAPDRIRCMLIRGGTSKGAYFLADDLPSDPVQRDDLLLRIMGSPDPRQIDGIGGAHPLTSKVAVVSVSEDPRADIDYLFLQIAVDSRVVSGAQTCGNLLAGVGPFAVERGLIPARGERVAVRIRLLNTGDLATATFPLLDGRPEYRGDAVIAGVPGSAAAIDLTTIESARPLLPTGRVVDVIEGLAVTLIDNGMPVAIIRASDVGYEGSESPEDLERDVELRARLEEVRRIAGPLMGLGDVSDSTVPKMFLVSAPAQGGEIRTRAFIPHRVHTSIGVLMASSVAAAARLPGSTANSVAVSAADDRVALEHPSGLFEARVDVRRDERGQWNATSTSVRTARPLFDGWVFPRP